MLRVRRRMGNIFEDAADFVSDTTGDVIDAVPGARDVLDAVGDAVTGPVRDFANTAVGRAMLSALATTVTGGLAPVLGPQLATVAFALPGLAAGQDFVSAWTQEFGSRVEQTAAIIGAEEAKALWSDQFDKAAAWLSAHGAETLLQMPIEDLAKAAGIREDFAAFLVAGAAGDLNEFVASLFDTKTGKRLPGVLQSMLDAAAKMAEAARLAAAKKSAHVAGRGTAVRGMVADPSRRLISVIHAPSAPVVAAPVKGFSSGDAQNVPARNGIGSTVAIAVLGVAAVGALVWWSRSS
jgi:hypothetical protein